MSRSFTCQRCGATFELSSSVRSRYPGWEPEHCRDCWRELKSGDRGGRTRRGSVEDNLTLTEVLETYDAGPDAGVFTDGSADPNPGPGGWGSVYVVDGEVVDQAHGHDPDTTNNRMELTAVLHGVDLVPPGTPATVYCDSKLVVNTLNEWAAGWEARGWKRKRGPVENLDLVRPAFEKVRARPELSIEWIAAHAGYRWNEYADSLATAYRRETL